MKHTQAPFTLEHKAALVWAATVGALGRLLLQPPRHGDRRGDRDRVMVVDEDRDRLPQKLFHHTAPMALVGHGMWKVSAIAGTVPCVTGRRPCTAVLLITPGNS